MLHDVSGNASYQTFISARGPSSDLTTITARRFGNVSINLPTVMESLTLAVFTDANGVGTITAERYGTITTMGIRSTTVLGDQSVSRLTNFNASQSSLPAVGTELLDHERSNDGAPQAVGFTTDDFRYLGLSG